MKIAYRKKQGFLYTRWCKKISDASFPPPKPPAVHVEQKDDSDDGAIISLGSCWEVGRCTESETKIIHDLSVVPVRCVVENLVQWTT